MKERRKKLKRNTKLKRNQRTHKDLGTGTGAQETPRNQQRVKEKHRLKYTRAYEQMKQVYRREKERKTRKRQRGRTNLQYKTGMRQNLNREP